MRNQLAALRAIVLALFVFLIVACSATQKQNEKKALEYSQMICVLAHSLLPVPAIQVACAIDDAAVPLIEPFLAEHRAAAMREAGPRASASAPPAPPPAPAASVPPAPAASSSAPPPPAPPAASSAAPAKKKKN